MQLSEPNLSHTAAGHTPTHSGYPEASLGRVAQAGYTAESPHGIALWLWLP